MAEHILVFILLYLILIADIFLILIINAKYKIGIEE